MFARTDASGLTANPRPITPAVHERLFRFQKPKLSPHSLLISMPSLGRCVLLNAKEATDCGDFCKLSILLSSSRRARGA